MSEKSSVGNDIIEKQQFIAELSQCSGNREAGKLRDEFLNVAHEITEVTSKTFGATELYPRTNLMVGLWWDTCYQYADTHVALVGIPRSKFGEYQQDSAKFELAQGYLLASANTGCPDIEIHNHKTLFLLGRMSPRELVGDLAGYVLRKTKRQLAIDAKIAADKPVWEQ